MGVAMSPPRLPKDVIVKVPPRRVFEPGLAGAGLMHKAVRLAGDLEQTELVRPSNHGHNQPSGAATARPMLY